MAYSEDEQSDDIALEQQWTLIEEPYRSGKLLKVRVIEATRKSMIVDAGGIQGSVEKLTYGFSMSYSPDWSEEEQRHAMDEHIDRTLAQMSGQEVLVRVIEVDRERNHLIVSQQLHTPEEREAIQRRREQLLRELQPGDIQRGMVKHLNTIGIRVDVDGVEGWIFRGYLAEHRVNDPAEIVQLGEEIEVMVLENDGKHPQFSLVHAQLSDKVLRTLHPGDVLSGRIISLSSDGVYVDLGGPIGLIPVDQVAHGYITHPADIFYKGQELIVKMERIDSDKRVLLSLVEVR